MKISVMSYGFHGLLDKGVMDIYGFLESCAFRYRVRAVDIWNGMLKSMEKAYIDNIHTALKERELELANLCVDGAHIWEDDEAVRKKNRASALYHLDLAEKWGAKTVRIDSGVHNERYAEHEFDHIVKTYKEFAQRAFDNGYRVGPENHWGAECTPSEMVRLCKAVDHPGFGVLVHFKDPDDKLFASYAMHTHISWETVHSNLEESLNTLKNAGYQGYWSLEHHSGKNEYAEMAIQVDEVRRIILGWQEAGEKV
jgi:sugar phosphate isomerase/epimerase